MASERPSIPMTLPKVWAIEDKTAVHILDEHELARSAITQ